jgi:hypothetical protein
VESPSYYAVIPANVRYSTDIPPNAKLLYGEITALCGKSGFCWATNLYFADLYGVTQQTVSEWVAKLCRAGFIRSEVDLEEGNKRKIWLIAPLQENPKTSSGKAEEGSSGKAEHNITSKNITINNTPKAPKGAEVVNGDFEDFWKAYPNKVGKPVALRAFLKAKAKQDELLAGLERWKSSANWLKNKGEFVPHPSTFLNQRRWEDIPRDMVELKSETEIANDMFWDSFLNDNQQKQLA